MPPLNIPVSQPNAPAPPDVQGASGSGGQPNIQNQNGLPMAGPQQQMQPPSHHETVALLEHISAFDRRWRQILEDPEVGDKNVKGMIYDAMADLMADEFATLPQTMSLLKTVPDEPLEQKQWLEQHVQNDQQAMAAVLQHRAQAGPPGSWEDQAAADGQAPADRNALVNGAVARYKKSPNKPPSGKGVPVRGRS